MYKILTLNKIAKCGLDRLDAAKYQITNDEKDPDGIILRSFSMHEMELGDNLKAVARAGAGTNNIPIDKCTEKGIVVFNTPGANANAVKELVIAGMLLASRKIVQGINWANSLTGDDVAKQVEKGKSNFAGCEIKGKTLGVIGLGAIGVLVANAAVELGMSVIGYDPYLSVDGAWKISSGIKHAAKIEDVFANSDYITIHVPLTPDTKDTVNKDSIAMMKDGVKIMNFARGGLVNVDDIKEALASGKVSCYVVDFPDSDVVGVEGVLPVPHLGASTEESEDNCAMMASDEISAYLETGNITNSVNLPNCSLPMGSGGRVAVIHHNKPKMIGAFTTMLSNADINISDMINKSKGENAYTIMNTDSPVSEELAKQMETVDGVVKVRVIA